MRDIAFYSNYSSVASSFFPYVYTYRQFLNWKSCVVDVNFLVDAMIFLVYIYLKLKIINIKIVVEVNNVPISVPDDQVLSLKLFVVLSKSYKAIMDHAVKDMKKHNLSTSEFTVLELLYHKGKFPLQQIGSKILVTSGSITYNIDKLEQKGYLRREPHTTDRRVTYAVITEEGKELFDTIFPIHAEAIHGIMQGLNTEEKGQAIELLKQLGKKAAQQA
jgi:MarR family 2-MHQ and catechol resistance regulon transcriptional repressor